MKDYACISAEEKVAGFVISGHTVQIEENGEYVAELFNSMEELEGVVVLKNKVPVGLIMKTYFFQKLSTPYGNSLYGKRPVSFLMETAIVTVDVNDDVDEISKLATSRAYSNLYDYIIVTQNASYRGVISIRQFLVALSDRNKEQLVELKLQNEKELSLISSLREKTQSVRNLLDNAGQGFLSFGADLMVKSEYSSECCKIFDSEISDQNYLQLIAPYFDDGKKSILLSILESFFAAREYICESAYLSLLPSEAVVNGRSILFEYKRIQGITGKDVMVILTDITEKKEMEKALEQDRETQRLIIKAITCKSELIQLINDFDGALQTSFGLYENQSDIKEFLLHFFRTIHTFKGDFAQYSFHNAMRTLHVFENRIQSLLNSSEIEIREIEEIINDAKDASILKIDMDTVEASLGSGYFSESRDISITEERMAVVFDDISAIISDGEKEAVKNAYHRLKHRNLKTILLDHKDYITYLAGRLEKGQPEYVVTGDNVYIDSNIYSPVLKNLIHIFRNSLDHGLETEEERVLLNKNPCGTITCAIKRNCDRFSIEISDDGQGIDVEKLKAKAVEKGIFTEGQLAEMDKAALFNLIFIDNLSTKASVSQVSGRGMGMSSLKNECLQLGGSISVDSEQNKGTKFTISLPLFH